MIIEMLARVVLLCYLILPSWKVREMYSVFLMHINSFIFQIWLDYSCRVCVHAHHTHTEARLIFKNSNGYEPKQEIFAFDSCNRMTKC